MNIILPLTVSQTLLADELLVVSEALMGSSVVFTIFIVMQSNAIERGN